jgi:STE24 endopeptidase
MAGKEESPPPYLLLFCVFSILAWGFELYLSLRQRSRLLKSEGPHELTNLSKVNSFCSVCADCLTHVVPLFLRMSQADFDAAKRYSLDKNGFNILNEAVNTIAAILFLLLNGMAWMWGISKSLISLTGFGQDEIVISLTFSAVFYVKSTIESIPWDLYETFVIEEQHGFNKQSFALWVRDQALTHFLFFVIGGPVLAIALFIIKWAGPNFYLYLWVFTTAVVFFMLTIYPNIIAPLFNKFTLLQPGSLKTAIDKLASLNGFPLKEVYVVDGSTRSSHSNAYFYGFGKNKRIVLYDTLSPTLQTAPKEGQVEFSNSRFVVFAH